MNITEALDALKEGKKIKHTSWGKDDFLALKDNDICFFRLEYFLFNFSPSILLTHDWETLDGTQKNLPFLKALEILSNGGRIKSKDVKGEFIEMDLSSKNILVRQISKVDFVMEHSSLLSNGWMEYK